jgi:hypothetical protein
MKTIILSRTNIIPLEDPNIKDSSKYTVVYSLVNEVGEYVHNADDAALNNKATEFDNETKIFSAKFTLHPSSKGKYYRLAFTITTDTNEFITSPFALIDVMLQTQNNSVQLIPNSYFRDYIINGELDDEIKDKLMKYPEDGIKEFIIGAQDDLELDLEMSLVPRTIEHESHDWFQDNLQDTHWMVQLYQNPVISIQSYALYYNTEKFLEISPSYLILNKDTGTVEYLPTRDQPFYLLIYETSLDVMARINSFGRSGSYGGRIPNVFRVSYTHGLDFMNLHEVEQTGIRSAIARKTMLKSLPRISPEVVTGNESASVDGVSYSKFNRGIEYLKMQQEEEKVWINTMRRKYNKEFKFITV